jgi:iron-sulfur cluster assembly accessory protein
VIAAQFLTLFILGKSYYFSLTVMTLRRGYQMTATALASTDVVLTDRAAKRVSRILAKEPEGTVLRISVAGGGCSGFQYEYNLVQEKPASDDIVLSKGDAVVLIDSMSLEFMGGSEIDFVDDLIGQAFQIKNPNAVASCGCGTSFAV